MNKNGLSNVYLNNLLTPYCKYFKGVFSCNTIPNFSKNQKFSCIINLSKENEEGTHYVSIFYDTKKIEYFDSFGYSNYNYDIQKYLDRLSTNIIYNSKTIQSIDSFFCGYYCAFFVLMKENGMSFKKIVDCFSSIDLNNNDKLLTEYLEYIFKIGS